MLEQALDLAVGSDDLVEAAECCGALAQAYFWSGLIERSRTVTQRRLELALQIHDPYQVRHIFPWMAVVSAFQGRTSESREYLDRAETEIRDLISPEPHAFISFCRAALAHFMSDYVEAERHMSTAIELFRQIGPNALVWYAGLSAMIDAALGKRDEARASLDEFDLLLDSMPLGSMPTSEPLAHITEAALTLGDRERLDRNYLRLKAFEGQFHDLSIDRQLGRIETLRGDYVSAEAHLRSAEEMARREDIVWEIAKVLEARADLVLVRDGPGAKKIVVALLSEAVDAIDHAISPTEHGRLRRRLEALTENAPAKPSFPAGLSGREAEVLSLVATGMSNRDIAARLFISEKTVINHLTHIYTKIGVDNRVAAAAFALRNDLA